MTTPTRSRNAGSERRHGAGGLVRELTPRAAAAKPEVILEARTAIDFLVSLVGDTEPELLPADRAWWTSAREALSVSVRRDLARAFGQSDDHHKGIVGWALIPLLIPRPEVRTASDVVAFSATVTAPDLLSAACVEDDMPTTRELCTRYFAGEAAVRDELLASAPEAMRDALRRMLDEPETELRAMRRVLRAWRDRFVEIEDRVGRMQEHDVASRLGALGRAALPDFIEGATNGYRWTPGTSIRRIFMTPSYFGRPYNYVFAADDWHMFAYPLAEAALDGDPAAVPAATVRLFRALGDEGRLRILRHLADGDLYLTEIAERMNLSKPTAKHHLTQLRAAGLVTVTETGGLTYYSLRRDRVADAGVDLSSYLGAPSS